MMIRKRDIDRTQRSPDLSLSYQERGGDEVDDEFFRAARSGAIDRRRRRSRRSFFRRRRRLFFSIFSSSPPEALRRPVGFICEHALIAIAARAHL